MTPRRVLLVHSSADRYGSDRQLALLASGLDPARWRPLVLVPEEGPLVGDLRAAGVDVLVHPLAIVRRSEPRPAALARALGADLRRLPPLVARSGAAVVHANTAVLAGVALARLGVPLVLHVREDFTPYGSLWPPWRRVLSRADAVLAISASVADQFVPPARVVPDGVVTPASVDRGAARAALDLPPDAWIVALPGRLARWKGQDVLLRALPSLPGVVAVLAGGAWRDDPAPLVALQRLASELGVAGRVRFLGVRQDIENVLAAADVVVQPSTGREPLGNAALEAAAAGRPVVASAHGGLPEVIADGLTGLLVAPGDPSALASALNRLRADPDLAARLGAAARRDVSRRFAPGRLLEAVQGIWDEVISDRPGRGRGAARLPRPVLEPEPRGVRGRRGVRPRGDRMTQPTATTSVRASTTVEVSQERAFSVFTEGMGTWWHRDQHILDAELAGMVFEPHVGGNVVDRGVDGRECRWARVLAYDPPERIVFSWDIDTSWKLETDPSRTSEVEVRFRTEGPDRTRVELEHRHLERHGAGWERMRDAVGSPMGWARGLERFADAA